MYSTRKVIFPNFCGKRVEDTVNGLDAADQDDQIGEDERRRRQNLTELDKRVEARCIWVMHSFIITESVCRSLNGQCYYVLLAS